MRIALTTTLTLLCGLFSLPVTQGTRLAEPPQDFVLQANGKELELRIGQPVELPKEFSGQKVTLRVRPTRLFDYQGLRFRYPQAYTWHLEALEDGGNRVTFSGVGNVLVLHVFPAKMEADLVAKRSAEATAEGWGAKSQVTKCEIAGKEKTRNLLGYRVRGMSGGEDRTQEFYGIPLGGETAMLVVQDIRTDAGELDPETKAMLDLLRESLEWPK